MVRWSSQPATATDPYRTVPTRPLVTRTFFRLSRSTRAPAGSAVRTPPRADAIPTRPAWTGEPEIATASRVNTNALITVPSELIVPPVISRR